MTGTPKADRLLRRPVSLHKTDSFRRPPRNDGGRPAVIASHTYRIIIDEYNDSVWRSNLSAGNGHDLKPIAKVKSCTQVNVFLVKGQFKGRTQMEILDLEFVGCF